MMPGLIYLIIFRYYPMYGILMAFKDFSFAKGIIASPWNDFANFKQLFQSTVFFDVLRNSVVLSVLRIVWGFPIPIILALLINEIRAMPYKRTTQTLMYLPHFISWVVAAGIITSALSPSTGIINQVLNVFGVEPVFFLAKKEYFRVIIVLSAMWKELGMQAIYYIAALGSIDQQLYEAAYMDGAGKLKQIWHVTLPGLVPMIIVLLVLKVGSLVTIGFEQIFLLYNPLVYSVGDVLSTYTYRLGIENANFSLTASIGLTQSAVNFLLVYSANKIARKVVGWSLW